MRHPHPGSSRRDAALLRHQFLQDGGLPFTDVLTDTVIADALAAIGGWLDRVFSPLVTLWVFLGQVLSADHSCRAAIARLTALDLTGTPVTDAGLAPLTGLTELRTLLLAKTRVTAKASRGWRRRCRGA